MVVSIALVFAINHCAQKYIAKPLIVDHELRSVGAFAAIKAHEPATYDAMRADLIAEMQNGADTNALKARALDEADAALVLRVMFENVA